MMLVYMCVTGPLAVKANRSFRQFVALRIRSEGLETDLQRQTDIAERANLAKSTFLAAASHDLRQPVHALTLFVGALREVPASRDAERLIEQIDASVNAMDKLFTALL